MINLKFILLFFFSSIDFIDLHLISVYYGNWKAYDRNFPICEIPFEKIDRLFYVFTKVSSGYCEFADQDLDLKSAQSIDGKCSSKKQPDTDPLKGNMYQLKLIKKKYPHLKVFFVIGGYGYTEAMHEYVMTNDTKKMQGFVKSCVDIYHNYSFAFDGVDIDYEYPCLIDDSNCEGVTPVENEKGLFVEFIAEFRRQLGSSALISLATSANSKKIDALDLPALNKLVDVYNVMTYDFTSGSQGDTYTGHHTQLKVNLDDPLQYRKFLSAELAGDYYLKNGANASKINIGVAFYGRAFYIQRGNTVKGPFISSRGAIDFGTWVTGMLDYYDIKMNYLLENNSYFDENATGPYILDNNRGLFITYDNEKSIREKVNIVNKKGFEGVFAYELTGDDINFTLLESMRRFSTSTESNRNYFKVTFAVLFFCIFIIVN